jgi:signal transduction histidine kinase
LFLAFKEALNNVVKHASATRVRVELKLAAEKLELLVADNGRGFSVVDALNPLSANPVGHARGNGLANMQRRLAEIGGTCDIHSEVGRGVEVKFTVPFRS